MTNKNTIEFVAGKRSAALINQLAEELNLTPEEVVQKGLAFMNLYATLKKAKGGRLLFQVNGEDPHELIL